MNLTYFPHFLKDYYQKALCLKHLLRKYKIDRNDYFGQLIIVGQDVVGAVTIEELE